MDAVSNARTTCSKIAISRAEIEEWNYENIFKNRPRAAGRPCLIFTIGSGGAGKSSVLKSQYGGLPDYIVINSDYLLESLFGEMACRELSKSIMAENFQRALFFRYNILVDGTAYSYDKWMQSYIRPAQKAGYTIKGIHVDVSLETAIARNAARDRKVSTEKIKEKYYKIKNAAEKFKSAGIKIDYINNDRKIGDTRHQE